MKRGFMDYVVTLMPDCPGQTAKWWAKGYLASGRGSDAKDKVQSLASTLSKQVRTGKVSSIRRERVGGVYCYFPARTRTAEEAPNLQDVAFQIAMSSEELEILDSFVFVGKFRNRSEVLAWFAREGFKARQDDIEKVANIRKQIEELKRSI
jgi:hypothetical protein